MRNLLLKILIRLLLGNLSDLPKSTLTKEVEDAMLSELWQNAAFKKRLGDRDAKIIYTMAGGEGLLPEKREDYALHLGQRVENLLWARDAKSAYMRRMKQIEQNKNNSPVTT